MFALKNPFKRTSRPENTAEDPPCYPPFVQGLPAATPSRLLKDHETLIDQIYQSVRATNEEYQKFYLPLMESYAAFVHLLPGSEAHHHRGAGGLLRHGLEVGFWALQQCENAIFGLEENPEDRRETALRWEFAVFAGGLCHDIGKCVSDMVITDRNSELEWYPSDQTLYSWLVENNIDRYYVRWREGRRGRHEVTGVLMLNVVLPRPSQTYMLGAGREPIECMGFAMLGSLSGGVENQIYTMINKADRASVEHDLKTNPLEEGLTGNVGTPVVQTLLDTMRRLVKKGSWKTNCHGARLWFISGRLFLAWPRCATEMTKLIESDGTPAMPRDPDTIADILFDRALAVPYRKEGDKRIRRYWQIEPEMLKKDGKPVTLMALELTNPTTLLEFTPPVTEGRILDPDNEGKDERQEDPDAEEPLPILEPVVDEYPIPVEDTPQAPPEPPSAQEDHRPQPAQEPTKPNKPKKSAQTEKSKKSVEQPEVPKDLFKSSFAETEPIDLPLTSEPVLASPGKTGPQVQAIATEAVADPNFFKANQSISGEVMEFLAEDLKKGKRQWRVDAVLTENNLVAIRYPQAIGSYGMDAKDILSGFKEQDWLEVNPLTLMNNCMEVDNFFSPNRGGKLVTRKALVLTQEATNSFLLLAGKSIEDLLQLQDQKANAKKGETTSKPEKVHGADIDDQPKRKKKGGNRKPNEKVREQKAMMLAGGARIADENNPPPERKDLLSVMRDLLLTDTLDVDWKDSKAGKYAPLDLVVAELVEKVNAQQEMNITRSDILGAFKDLRHEINIRMKNKDQIVIVPKESGDGE